jgi:hypothetical protein
VVIDLCARFAAATARAEALLNAAPRAGVDLDDLERIRRRLVAHEREYDRTRVPARRGEIVKLMDREIEILAGAYKKLEVAVVNGGAATT